MVKSQSLMVVSVVQLPQPYCTVLNQLSFSPPYLFPLPASVTSAWMPCKRAHGWDAGTSHWALAVKNGSVI